MSRPLVGPGKTAPKLYHDLLRFDPLQGRPNVLTELTAPVGEGPPLGPPIGSCQHEYAVKHSQSVLPPLDLRPDGTSHHVLAATCKKCRVHLHISLNHSPAHDPCPTSEYLLHHFQRDQTRDVQNTNGIAFGWTCSAPTCRALLDISYRPPRLTRSDLNLLSNTEILKSRFESVVRRDPTRDGMRQATPTESLNRLRKYIKDSLNPEHTRRTFPANNKRFMEAFGWYGSDCQQLLEDIGFTYDADEIQWTLPEPATIDDRLLADGTSLRELLEDVEMEMLAWMNTLALTIGAVNPSALEQWASANRDIERTLQAQGYNRYWPLHRRAVAPNEHEFFSSLGALTDFHYSLIEFAFERQTECDPALAPYYLECLQVITEARGTEQLQMRVSVLASQNMISRRDIEVAFRSIGLHATSARSLSDEEILQKFHARVQDLGAQAAENARQALLTIGTYRGSEVLLRASRQTIETYEEALAWLGSGMAKDSSDDAILTAFAIKTGDSPGDVESGRKAVSIIAQERKSAMLNNWLLTGRADGQTMSVDEALRYLGVEQNLESIDQTVLPAIFDSARADRPGEQTEKAIATIEQSLMSSGKPSHAPNTWPVGLISHGNTCYLNSLLQYYFSIKDFRDIVLSYDEYKLDTTPYQEDPQRKKEARVGGLQRAFDVIKGAQYFSGDLQRLFEHMITAPGPAVRPETDLVCRAFLRPEDWALLDASKRSQAPSKAPSVNGDVESTQQLISIDSDGPKDDQLASSDISMASSETLQGSPGETGMDTATISGELPPTPPASPGRQFNKVAADGPQIALGPPLPPRPLSIEKESPLALAERNAREQQDVTEVHDAALDRLRVGMRPDGVDREGEQIDGLRNLFNIDMTQTSVNRGVPGKPRAVPTTAVQVNVPVPNEAIDIYSALDGFFDLQPVEDNPALESYKSLAGLPPLFQISIPRAGYDPQTGAFFKSNGCVKLEDELYLDRYLDALDPEILPLRKQCWGWRKRLHVCRAESRALSATSVDLEKPVLLKEAANFVEGLSETDELLQEVGLSPIGSDADLCHTLVDESVKTAHRHAQLEREIDMLQKHLDQMFAEKKRVKYRLAAVFIHRGSQGGGHYWIYIHDFANGLWRSYNDENVEEFTQLQHMYEAQGGAQNTAPPQGTPTYAVYVKDDLKEKLIQPVCRQPQQVSEPVDPPVAVAPPSQDVPQIIETHPAEAIDSQQADAVDATVIDEDVAQHVEHVTSDIEDEAVLVH